MTFLHPPHLRLLALTLAIPLATAQAQSVTRDLSDLEYKPNPPGYLNIIHSKKSHIAIADFLKNGIRTTYVAVISNFTDNDQCYLEGDQAVMQHYTPSEKQFRISGPIDPDLLEKLQKELDVFSVKTGFASRQSRI